MRTVATVCLECKPGFILPRGSPGSRMGVFDTNGQLDPIGNSLSSDIKFV